MSRITVIIMERWGVVSLRAIHRKITGTPSLQSPLSCRETAGETSCRTESQSFRYGVAGGAASRPNIVV